MTWLTNSPLPLNYEWWLDSGIVIVLSYGPTAGATTLQQVNYGHLSGSQTDRQTCTLAGIWCFLGGMATGWREVEVGVLSTRMCMHVSSMYETTTLHKFWNYSSWSTKESGSSWLLGRAAQLSFQPHRKPRFPQKDSVLVLLAQDHLPSLAHRSLCPYLTPDFVYLYLFLLHFSSQIYNPYNFIKGEILKNFKAMLLIHLLKFR